MFWTAAGLVNPWHLARRGKFGHSHDLVAATAEIERLFFPDGAAKAATQH